MTRWTSVGVAFGQRCRRLTDTEPAMGCNAGPTLNRNWVGRPTWRVRGTSQQTRGLHPMIFQCRASVEDGGPTLKLHRVNASCLLGS